MKPLPQFTEEALLAITVAVLALLVYLTFPFAAAGICLTNPHTGAHRGTQATRATVAVDPQTHAPQPNPAAASFFDPRQARLRSLPSLKSLSSPQPNPKEPKP